MRKTAITQSSQLMASDFASQSALGPRVRGHDTNHNTFPSHDLIRCKGRSRASVSISCITRMEGWTFHTLQHFGAQILCLCSIWSGWFVPARIESSNGQASLSPASGAGNVLHDDKLVDSIKVVGASSAPHTRDALDRRAH